MKLKKLQKREAKLIKELEKVRKQIRRKNPTSDLTPELKAKIYASGLLNSPSIAGIQRARLPMPPFWSRVLREAIQTANERPDFPEDSPVLEEDE